MAHFHFTGCRNLVSGVVKSESSSPAAVLSSVCYWLFWTFGLSRVTFLLITKLRQMICFASSCGIIQNHSSYKPQCEGCLTVHLPHEITWNANLMQQGNFINVFLARHVSGIYAHHQEHWMLCCSKWFSAPSFWMGGGLESRCVGRVYGADVAARRTAPSAP